MSLRMDTPKALSEIAQEKIEQTLILIQRGEQTWNTTPTKTTLTGLHGNYSDGQRKFQPLKSPLPLSKAKSKTSSTRKVPIENEKHGRNFHAADSGSD
jgi:hypothetical protein